MTRTPTPWESPAWALLTRRSSRTTAVVSARSTYTSAKSPPRSMAADSRRSIRPGGSRGGAGAFGPAEAVARLLFDIPRVLSKGGDATLESRRSGPQAVWQIPTRPKDRDRRDERGVACTPPVKARRRAGVGGQAHPAAPGVRPAVRPDVPERGAHRRPL